MLVLSHFSVYSHVVSSPTSAPKERLCSSKSAQKRGYAAQSPHKREVMQLKVRIFWASVSLTLSLSLFVSLNFRACLYKSPEREHVQLKVQISCVCVCLCSLVNTCPLYPIFSQKNPIPPANKPQNSRSCSTCLVRVRVNVHF